jgi:hypothetical protein
LAIPTGGNEKNCNENLKFFIFEIWNEKKWKFSHLKFEMKIWKFSFLSFEIIFLNLKWKKIKIFIF